MFYLPNKLYLAHKLCMQNPFWKGNGVSSVTFEAVFSTFDQRAKGMKVKAGNISSYTIKTTRLKKNNNNSIRFPDRYFRLHPVLKLEKQRLKKTSSRHCSKCIESRFILSLFVVVSLHCQFTTSS